jgi:hypothetical protein
MRILAVVLTATTLITGCSDNATGPSAADNRLTATIDGQPITATILVAFISRFDGRSILNLTALEGCNSGWSINLHAERLPIGGALAEGTYSMANTQQVGSATSFSTHREMSGSAMFVQQGVYSYWDAPGAFGSGGSGTLQITSLTSTHVEGTFTFQGVARTGNTVSGATKAVSGNFRAVLRDTRIC